MCHLTVSITQLLPYKMTVFIHVHCEWVFRAYFPPMVSSIILVRKHVVWAFSVCASATVWPVKKIEKNVEQCEKSQKCYISRIWGEPQAEPLCPKIYIWGDVSDIIAYAKFQNESLRGCNSTGGRNFTFFYWFWMAINEWVKKLPPPPYWANYNV